MAEVILRDTSPLAVIVPRGPQGGKGDPGGNVMAIGLFSAATGLSIPVGSDLVRTSGHAAHGRGVADYFYDAAVDAAYVAANPRTSFISANGRGFRLAQGAVTLDKFGALGDGLTDDTSAIQTAVDYLSALGGGFAFGREGAIYLFGTSATLTLETAAIDLQGSTLKAAADRDLIALKKEAVLISGSIDVSGVPGFTSKAVAFKSGIGGDSPHMGASSFIRDVSITGADPGVGGLPTGRAVSFDVEPIDGHSITFSGVRRCDIRYFAEGAIADVPAAATGANWCNSCFVDGETTFNDVIVAVRGTVVSGSTSAVSQWTLDYTVQARSTRSSLQRVLDWGGNLTDGVIHCWDIDGHLADGIAVETRPTSERNNIDLYGVLQPAVIERSVGYRGNHLVCKGASYGGVQRFSTPPLNQAIPISCGMQDNYLSYAATRPGWAITVTDAALTPVAPTSGSVTQIFDPDPTKAAFYLGFVGTLILTVDMATAVSGPQQLGAAFLDGYQPDRMKIETSLNGSAWTTWSDKTGVSGSVSVLEYWNNVGSNGTARYVRFTFINNTARDLRIYLLWGVFKAKPNTFAERYQPNVEASLSVNGVKVIGPRLTGWTADTGTSKKTANATYAGGTAGATYTQAEITAIKNALQDATQTIKALKDALITHGLIGT